MSTKHLKSNVDEVPSVRPRGEYRIGTIFSVLLLALLLTSCGESTRPDANADKYFSGREGIVTNFENVPTKLYYYNEETSENDFSFGVEVQNKGASYTRGAVYLSGFNPDMLIFEGLDIGASPTACGISIGSIGAGQIGGILRCENFAIGVGEGQGITDVRIDSLATFIRSLSGNHDVTWLDENRFDVSFDYSDRAGASAWSISFKDYMANIDYYQHGRLFIAVFGGIDFRLNGGREFLLAGDTYEYPQGEYEYLQYRGKIVNWPPGLDKSDQTLQLTTCYMYTTYAAPMVCVDPDPQSNVHKVCRPRSRTWSGGQGAPVSVTSIEQENTPRELIFRINVKNIGTGRVFDAGQMAKCSPYYPGRSPTPEDLNVVYLGDVRVGDVGLRGAGMSSGMSCFPEVIRLDPRTKSGSTTCKYPIQYTQIKSAYEVPLVVELWYGYEEVKSRTVQIQRLY
jgi:hypothetical protein